LWEIAIPVDGDDLLTTLVSRLSIRTKVALLMTVCWP
jgi:hypothetical protein